VDQFRNLIVNSVRQLVESEIRLTKITYVLATIILGSELLCKHKDGSVIDTILSGEQTCKI
jgi:hypothetical protein